MNRATLRERLSALVLIMPLLAFLAVFFLWPLWTMVTAAVVDDTVSRVLPRTAAAIVSWDGRDLPRANVQEALIEDLRRSSDQQALGETVRRLNSAVSGFRTLLGRTTNAVRDGAAARTIDLANLDPRWKDPRFWQALKDAVPPYTDRNLLAAGDSTRDPDGATARAPRRASAA